MNKELEQLKAMPKSITISYEEMNRIRTVTGESQGKRPTKAQLKRWGIIK